MPHFSTAPPTAALFDRRLQMYNTGARVSEMTQANVRDLRLSGSGGIISFLLIEAGAFVEGHHARKPETVENDMCLVMTKLMLRRLAAHNVAA